jgi:hypothetical protein
MTVFAHIPTAMECKQQCEINQTPIQLPQSQLHKLVILRAIFPKADYDI